MRNQNPERDQLPPQDSVTRAIERQEERDNLCYFVQRRFKAKSNWNGQGPDSQEKKCKEKCKEKCNEKCKEKCKVHSK